VARQGGPSSELELSAGALIVGWQFPANGPARELAPGDVPAALGVVDAVTWLHFSLADARAAHFLANSTLLPARVLAALAERDSLPGASACDAGLLVVMNDLSFDAQIEFEERTTLWAFATPRLAVTVRSHPARSADALRLAVRDGERFASGIDVVARLYELRTEALEKIVGDHGEQVGDIEDQVLGGGISQQREALGRIRRQCGRIRRYFVSDRTVIAKLLTRLPPWFRHEDGERFAHIGEDLAYLLEEVGELYERAKLLQEELGSRLAEDTNRRLFVLSTLSAVLMPMTLVTGIWGMNAGGMPGLESEAGFWWLLLGIAAVGAATLWVLRRSRLL
jgi:zinc transporter